jgi:hypothetical protein
MSNIGLTPNPWEKTEGKQSYSSTASTFNDLVFAAMYWCFSIPQNRLSIYSNISQFFSSFEERQKE